MSQKRAILIFLSVIGVRLAAKYIKFDKSVPVVQNVTFNKNIRPITSTVCFQCHQTDKDNWSIYSTAFNNREKIYRKVVVERTMPFGKFMSEHDRSLFRDWVKQGAKQ